MRFLFAAQCAAGMASGQRILLVITFRITVVLYRRRAFTGVAKRKAVLRRAFDKAVSLPDCVGLSKNLLLQ
ncbi:MAG: hypothetical protein LAO06_14760 [Acidobacteriia bacterium]|nr:hypothetical protein [Terriglobia bacterium]